MIPPDDVPKYWHDVFPLLAKPLNYNRDGMLLSDVLNLLKEDRMQLWIVVKGEELVAACTTQLMNPYGKKICRHVLMGGEGVREWLDDYLDTVESWAKAEGCCLIEAVGRPGWIRFGRPRGYEHTYTVIQKEL